MNGILRTICSTSLVVSACAVNSAFAVDRPYVLTAKSTLSEKASPGIRRIGSLSWHTDYESAYIQAREEQKQLFLFFRDEKQRRAADDYEQRVLAAEELQKSFEPFVRVVLSVNAVLPEAGEDEDPKRLLDHKGFVHLHKRQGIAVIDLTEPGSTRHGWLVSAHSFSPGRSYSLLATKTILKLPRGTITQRALIYAIRIHPDRPQSAESRMHPFLNEQARVNSATMARLEQVGHHDFGTRYQAVADHLGNYDVREVAASGSGETLIEAAIDCVLAWRGSPGHWQIVSGQSANYGYDLVRGGSGMWYATGLVAGGQ